MLLLGGGLLFIFDDYLWCIVSSDIHSNVSRTMHSYDRAALELLQTIILVSTCLQLLLKSNMSGRGLEASIFLRKIPSSEKKKASFC